MRRRRRRRRSRQQQPNISHQIEEKEEWSINHYKINNNNNNNNRVGGQREKAVEKAGRGAGERVEGEEEEWGQESKLTHFHSLFTVFSPVFPAHFQPFQRRSTCQLAVH